jgi:molybdopterin molybdotransferase
VAEIRELTVAEARARVLVGVVPLDSESVPLLAALGRVLAEDAVSDIDVAPFDNSMMDGFAVRAPDLAGAHKDAPVALDVTGAVFAGEDGAGVRIVPGSAVRIMTGAPLPAGADAVVMVERTAILSGDGGPGSRVAFAHAPDIGEKVRRRGEEVEAGGVVLRAGEVVDPAAVGLLAATGNACVTVRRRSYVAVLSTGDELVAVGDRPRAGQIRDANSPMLAALVAEAGGEPVPLAGVGDDEAATREALLRAAASADAVVVTGGVSVGDRDFVGGLLGELGEVYCRRVRMRPGAPNTLGRLGGVPFFGLPGNPTSAWVGFHLFVRPVLRTMAGFATVDRPVVMARLSHDVSKKQDRAYYVRGRLSSEPGGLSVESAGPQSSALLTAAHRANCLIVLDLPAGLVPAGTLVPCLRLDAEEGTP